MENLCADLRAMVHPSKELPQLIVKHGIQLTNEIDTWKNIGAFHKTCDKVNVHLLSKEGRDRDVILGGEEWVCTQRGKAETEGGMVTLSMNFIYRVVYANSKKVTFSDGMRDDLVMNIRPFRSHFQRAFCMTAHSFQGQSLDEKYTIFDWQNRFTLQSKEWIYTAISRARSLSDVFLYNKSIVEDFDTSLQARVQRMCQMYYANDITDPRFAHMTEEAVRSGEFVDEAWILAALERTPKCEVCLEMLDIEERKSRSFSVDRISNFVGHIKSNCRLICHLCNVTRK